MKATNDLKSFWAMFTVMGLLMSLMIIFPAVQQIWPKGWVMTEATIESYMTNEPAYENGLTELSFHANGEKVQTWAVGTTSLNWELTRCR